MTWAVLLKGAAGVHRAVFFRNRFFSSSLADSGFFDHSWFFFEVLLVFLVLQVQQFFVLRTIFLLLYWL